jgi:nucleotide-binding universal stress UspA family protein
MLGELERRGATLAVVGTHGRRRAVGIALGSVATRLLHDAPCAVLVARPPANLERWPRSIVLGLDGSVPSALAAAAAWALADRVGAGVRAIAGAGADAEAARRIAPDVELHEARPVDALVVASEHADLVVVGSRGVTGVRALGSVSERVGHEARSSVLVVRER